MLTVDVRIVDVRIVIVVIVDVLIVGMLIAIAVRARSGFDIGRQNLLLGILLMGMWN